MGVAHRRCKSCRTGQSLLVSIQVRWGCRRIVVCRGMSGWYGGAWLCDRGVSGWCGGALLCDRGVSGWCGGAWLCNRGVSGWCGGA